MLSLSSLAALAADHCDELDQPVAPLLIGEKSYDTDLTPVIMGTVNLSRDSTYRESIAIDGDSAIRKARIMAAQGAHFIDIGAESSTTKAARVTADDQIAALVPVIEQLTADGIDISAETYEPKVVRACLRAGAKVLNLTGSANQAEMFELAAEFNATVILCYVKGDNVREITDVTLDADPFPGIRDHFAERIAIANAAGVDRIAIDPGMGFYYGNLVTPAVRVQHQTHVLLNGFRLRALGLPVCNALPHAFDLFEDQFRTAEGFFAVLASLGGTGIYRTHEVAHVASVLSAMRTLNP
ncbi:MAG: dihydropteroate synthase [Candidatus Nanopelagicales bacterium]